MRHSSENAIFIAAIAFISPTTSYSFIGLPRELSATNYNAYLYKIQNSPQFSFFRSRHSNFCGEEMRWRSVTLATDNPDDMMSVGMEGPLLDDPDDILNMEDDEDDEDEDDDEPAIAKKRGRPKKSDGDEIDSDVPKRKDKDMISPFVKTGETPHPQCRAHLAIVHSGKPDDCHRALELKTLLNNHFGPVVNVHDEPYAEQENDMFEVWLEGTSVIRLFSKDVELEGEINDFNTDRIIRTIEEEVSNQAQLIYGPF